MSDEGSPIARATFEELQATAGADFVVELVDTFLEEAPAMLAALRAALAAGDAEAFRRTAHSLKSNSNTFGAHRLGELAREFELGGLDRARGAGAQPLAALEAEYARAAKALAELRDA
jgi:HPt (histidine-containing phosphotransfer) domain-containing protein